MANFCEGTSGGYGANEHSMNIDEGPRICLPPMRDPYRNKTYDAEHMLPRVGELILVSCTLRHITSAFHV